MIETLLDKIYDSDFYDFFGAEYGKLEFIESLVDRASISEKEKDIICHRLKRDAFTELEADNIIEYLYERQIDLIQSGFSYNQTDIKRKLNEFK